MLSKEQRQTIIKLRNEGMKQEQIARVIGCSQVTVSKWIAKYKNGRTLETLPRSGRPTKLKGKVLDRLRKKILKAINEANEHYSSVQIKQISKIIKEEIGKEYTIRHVERIMHKLGFSLVTPRPQHIKHDQEKVDAFREQFKKNSNRGIWAMN